MSKSTSVLRSAALWLFAAASLVPALVAQSRPGPDLPAGCEALQVPAGNCVSQHVFAQGAQVYQWDAAASRWAFQGPVALLFADAGCTQPVGSHFVGPTWVSNSGSSVVGSVLAGATVDPNAIPWLLLRAVSTEGAGPFAGTTFIQRVGTTGGRAPARAGSPNETVWIPYTAEYYFYRAKD